MAVSPYDLEQKFEHELDVFETDIDEILNKKSLNKGGYITVPIPKNMTITHFNVLKSRYLSVGWYSVELISDQRFGSFLKFGYDHELQRN
jgi:hypothetical protein